MKYTDSCYEIKSTKMLIEYLNSFEKNLSDADLQLETNYADVFFLDNGEVVLLPNKIKEVSKGLLFCNLSSLNNMIEKDYFPLENEEKEIYEYDYERIKSINRFISYYMEELNQETGLSHDSLTKEVTQDYYQQLLKIRSQKELKPQIYIAFGAIIGEIIRKEKNGKWLLIKRYGTYNPFYEPKVLTQEQMIISPYSKMFRLFEGNFKEVDFIFKDVKIQKKQKDLEILKIQNIPFLVLE